MNSAHDDSACPGRLVTWNPVDGLSDLWSADDDREQIHTLEIDPLARKLYFGGSCERSNFDFSERERVVTPTWGCLGNAVDPLDRKFYWLDLVDDNWVIRRVDLDGGDPQNLVTAPIPNTGSVSAFDLKIDPCAQKMYWTNIAEGRIERADLDGTNVETVLTTLAFRLKLDIDAGKMYWTKTGSIYRANLDGTDMERVFISPDGCNDLAIDPVDDRIYCITHGTHDCSTGIADIFRTDSAGALYEVVFSVAGAGLGLAVVNDSWNGPDCSTLCIGVNDCSGHGECVAFGTCQCNSGWGGADCSVFNCVDVSDCSSHGTCIGANSCACDPGWSDDNCAAPICNGVNACSGTGICIAPDVCACDSGWTGTDCAQITCITQANCFGNGDCVGPNQCDCFENWSGADCSIPLCGGQDHCSGHGTCVAPDVCDCDPEWSGDACETAICSSVSNCSGNGVCVTPNVCDCASGWIGADCSTVALGEVALIPVGADRIYQRNDDEITVTPGQIVYLEIRVGNWDRDQNGSPLLSATNVQIDSSTWTSGSQGVLLPYTPPCSTDAECQTAVHRASTCGVTKQCTAGFVDKTRSDHVFAAVSNTSSVDLSGPDPVFATSSTGGAVADPGASTYAGTLVLFVSNDAAGTFEVAASASPVATFLSDEGAVLLEPLELIGTKITVTNEELYSRKNRFLTVQVGRPDRQESIRATAVDLTGDFVSYNGTQLWVGEPTQLSERTDKGLGDPLDPGEPFTWVAELQCDAFFTDWTQYPEPIHVYHELVTPGSVYDVQTLDDAFDPAGAEQNFSQPATLFTPRWGDVTQMFDTEAGIWEPPGTDVNIQVDILDVLAMVSAFQGASNAPIKARWDLQGKGTGVVDGTIDILDILLDVSAFSGVPYPFLPSGAPCQ